jgi:hypothetical protein
VPSFHVESADLWNDGPLVEVHISLTAAAEAANAAASQPNPAAVPATALIDTGASHSAVRAGILAPLGLHPVGVITIATPSSHNVQCPLYSVRLTLPQGGFLDTTVSEVPLQGQNIDALMGRDVLRFGILIYQGTIGQFTLSF